MALPFSSIPTPIVVGRKLVCTRCEVAPADCEVPEAAENELSMSIA